MENNNQTQRAKKLYYEGKNSAVDVAITRKTKDGKTQILLIQRPDGSWSLPGGFVEKYLLKAGRNGIRITGLNEVLQETGLKKKFWHFSMKEIFIAITLFLALIP
jgi:ADP-ribose pyrophosphatase YjhB (NUDIX family)